MIKYLLNKLGYKTKRKRTNIWHGNKGSWAKVGSCYTNQISANILNLRQRYPSGKLVASNTKPK